MSESEDEDFAFYGVPLEPIDEDTVPRKKPFAIQDQIATDKQGRRRFHGAFTGGFSAGFYNSVGTLEGWKPSQFKSSREKKADVFAQRPEDFMDEEDTEEFGIAPTLLRAKPEYSGGKSNKRRIDLSEGPIPGEPVLKNILEPPSMTIGMKLLMKLGWKPGQGVGPMLTWAEKMGGDIDPEELGLDPNVLFPPDPIQEHCINAKINRFGLGYVGLSKEPVLKQRFSLFDAPLKVSENKKKLSIRGQAFGVGAFEDEDDDIYAKDDMSRYDFALETSASIKEARRKEKQKEKEMLALTENYNCIEGFMPAKNQGYRKKYYPPPELPSDFDPNITQRKSRFGPEIVGNVQAVKGKHIINSSDRAIILGESLPDNRLEGETVLIEESQSENNTEDNKSSNDLGFRPFISDPDKQARYERYLGFIKIGANDALKNIQPSAMSEWEKQREAKEFEQAAKLYRPLSGMMNDRFSRGGMLDDSADPLAPVSKSQPIEMDPWVKAAKEKKFGKLTRFIADWCPVSLLCKRMNIPEPNNSEVTLAKVAEAEKKRRPKFSVFDFLDTSKDNNITVTDNSVSVTKVTDDSVSVTKETKMESKAINDANEKENDKPKAILSDTNYDNVIKFEDPQEKMDLFKAIFASSDEESDVENGGESSNSKKKESNSKALEKPISSINVLRNTSPPRGIFANLDLDALKPKKLPQEIGKEKQDKNDEIITKNASEIKNPITCNEPIAPELMYGPSLPTKPIFIQKTTTFSDSESSSSEIEWVEKSTSKKKKHSKKHKKEKKKDKHKQKKKKKKS